MKKRRKGTTLIEVLVSIAVFAIVSAGMFASLVVPRKIAKRQEEYLRFGTVCSDIAFYGDAYGKNWDTKYFSEGIVTHEDEGERRVYRVYYGADFTPGTDGIYLLEYFYDEENNLIVNIKNTATGRAIVEDLNYGGGRYAE